MVNFTAKYCNTAEKLFDSNVFKRVLKDYFMKIKNKDTNIYKYICTIILSFKIVLSTSLALSTIFPFSKDTLATLV